MAVSGGGEAEVEAGGTAVSWSVGGKAWLEYLGLSAFDVAGRSLPARLDTSASGLSIEVDDVGAAYPVIVDPFIQEAKLSASDGVVGDQLGFSVAIWGNTVVAGDPMATIGGNPFQGAAYVFVEPGTGWANATETAKLTASDGAVSDGFGFSVAISGNTIVVGEPTGSAVAGVSYVFVKPGTGWAGSLHEAARLTPSDLAASNFGFSVAISGSTVVAGAPVSSSSRGAVYVFVEPGTGWTGDLDETARLTASDGASLAYFGSSVGISGDTVVAGMPGSNANHGAAYVFAMPAAGWASTSTFDAKLTADDGVSHDVLGVSVAISGDTVVAGATGANGFRGAAYVFAGPPACASPSRRCVIPVSEPSAAVVNPRSP
jgi:uncharacterized protein (DUF2345 family)